MKTIQNPQNGMTNEEQLARVEKCSALGLCFISLKELVFKAAGNTPVDKYKYQNAPNRAVNVLFGGVEVAVCAQYVK